MRNYVILSFLLCLLDKAVCQIISTNASWNGQLELKCSHDQSLIFVKEALFGSLGEKGRPACTIHVGSYVRDRCNKKNSCKLGVILGPFLNPKKVNCTSKPDLYAKHVCINKGASIMDLSQIARKWSGYVKPTEKIRGGYEPGEVSWKTVDELCKTLPRSVQFELVDLNLADDCNQEQLLIRVSEGTKEKQMGPFCAKDLDQVPIQNRTCIFSNITKVTFEFKTKNRHTESRGFLLKFIAMQCRPVPQIPNTIVEYSLSTDRQVVKSRIRCGEDFLPWFGTPAEVVASCNGNGCIYECDDPSACNTGWKRGALGARESRKIEDMKCVLPSALKTTTTTTTTATPTTTTFPRSSSAAAVPDLADLSTAPPPTTTNSTAAAAVPAFPPDPTRRTDKRHVIAGIIGGVVGIVACLIVGILGLMVCRKTRCPLCCLNSPYYDKASYAGSQAVSHDGKTFGDSTLALRYRPPSTISTQVPNGTLASVQRSSAGSSILFPSNRRSKRKTLPHPSTLGYGPYDETVPFFSEPHAATAFSPSVETYLEPDRRPSGPPLPPPTLLSFAPKPSPRGGVYQIYDENRSSRNALDRCDAPRHDRHSMALISNHYYCRGEGSDDAEDSDNSVYEVVEEGHYSAGSTPCESRRNFPSATRNDYVQPPRLPARPATMRRSHQDLPAAPLAGEEEDEDGYQPVNCANRPTA